MARLQASGAFDEEIKTRESGQPFVVDFNGAKIQKYDIASRPVEEIVTFEIVQNESIQDNELAVELHIPCGTPEDYGDTSTTQASYVLPSSVILEENSSFELLTLAKADIMEVDTVVKYNVLVFRTVKIPLERLRWMHHVQSL